MATFEEALYTAYADVIGSPPSYQVAIVRRDNDLDPWQIGAHALSASAIGDAQIEAEAYLLSLNFKVITKWYYGGDMDYGSRAVYV